MRRSRRRTPLTRAMRRPAICSETHRGICWTFWPAARRKERAEVVADLQKDDRLMRMEARNRQIKEDEYGTKMNRRAGFRDKHFNEVLFCEDFLSAHPMVCGRQPFFTVRVRVVDEEGIRKQIYEMLRPYLRAARPPCATTLLETLRLEAYTPELPIQKTGFMLPTARCFSGRVLHGERILPQPASHPI